MNMKSQICKGLILGLGGLLTSSACATMSKVHPSAKSVVGTWELVSDDFRRPNGQIIPFPGLSPGARGVLMYDAGGRMAVHIMAPDRPSFESTRNAPCDQLRASLRGYRGYFGTYQVNARAGTVTHHVVGSPFAALVGQSLTRRFKMTGDELVLEAPERASGEEGTAIIKWKRAA